MPHIIIEHSIDFSSKEIIQLAHEIQKTCGQIQGGNFDYDQFKIRSLSFNNYGVGSDGNNANFIHISIKILQGRSLEIKKQLSENCFKIVQSFFENSGLNQKRCDLSLDVIEMDRDLYHKQTIRALNQ